MVAVPGKERINSPTAKELLALIRGADYAHPGEDEAIRLLIADAGEAAAGRTLDVGCGRGGTAEYMRQQGMDVRGFDYDSEAIQYATLKYPELDLTVCNVTQCASCYPDQRFNFLYSINLFHLLTEGECEQAFDQLAQISAPDALLVISDYSRNIPDNDVQPFDWNALYIPDLTQQAQRGGWCIERVIDNAANYIRWYTHFVAKVESLQVRITRDYGPGWYQVVHNYYSTQLRELHQGNLASAVIHLRPEPAAS